MADPIITPGGSMPLSPGPYPGLYHVIDFTERLGSGGPEATVLFEGPSDRRFELIEAIFPYWGVTHNGTTNICCPFLVSEPTPYPDLATARSAATYPPDMDFGEEFENKTAGICEPKYDTLWPETFFIRKGARTCRPQRFPCTNIADAWPTEPDPLNYPLYFAEADSLDACSCVVEVNYRRRYHAGWPSVFRNCGDTDLWELPDIPLGTYIEVRTDPTVNFKTIRGRELKYQEHLKFNEPDYSVTQCGTKETVGGLPEWQFCTFDGDRDYTDPASFIVSSDLSGGQIVNSSSIEITWSGVPVPPLKKLDGLRGTVNDQIFLGFPPESVLFESYNAIPRGNFGVFDLYDIVFSFATLTSPVSGNFDVAGESDADDIVRILACGVFNGQIGLWNRLWSNKGLESDILGDGSKRMCTNWCRVVNNTSDCCTTSSTSIYKPACFQDMFELGGVCP